MATQDDVRRLCLALPGTTEDPANFRFFVDGRQFVWVWMQRIVPKKPRVANRDVIALRVVDETTKQGLLSLDPDVFFTEPHYDGYPAVLVRLPDIDMALLEKVIDDSWRSRAGKDRP